MKKLVLFGLAALLMLTLCSCGNYDLFDTNYTYDYAIISFPDGSVQTIEIEQWTDYEGEQIQIIAKDGTVYLLSTVNCILVNEPD